jgi:acyl carrier protein
MEINEFVANFVDLFDDTDASEIQPSTVFHDLEEWSSLTGMGCIALAKTQYGKAITGAELRACVTVEDVFNLINNK